MSQPRARLQGRLWRTHPRKHQNLRQIGDCLLCPKAPSVLGENAIPFDAAWTERAVSNFSPHPLSPDAFSFPSLPDLRTGNPLAYPDYTRVDAVSATAAW